MKLKIQQKYQKIAQKLHQNTPKIRQILNNTKYIIEDFQGAIFLIIALLLMLVAFIYYNNTPSSELPVTEEQAPEIVSEQVIYFLNYPDLNLSVTEEERIYDELDVLLQSYNNISFIHSNITEHIIYYDFSYENIAQLYSQDLNAYNQAGIELLELYQNVLHIWSDHKYDVKVVISITDPSNYDFVYYVVEEGGVTFKL